MILTRSINRVPIYRYQPETLTNGFSLSDITAGNVSERSLQHLDKFIRDCKEAGLWSKLTFLMPFIGNNLSTAIREIISAAATSAVNFVAGDWSEATGLTGNGSTKYVDTGISNTIFGVTGHIAFYQRTDNASSSTRYQFGFGNGVQEFWLGSSNPSTTTAGRYGGATSVVDSNPTVKGLYYMERVSATDLRLYRNATQIGATQTTNITPAPPGGNIFAWALNTGASPSGQNQISGSFLSIGAIMSATERATYYALVQTLQTNLGRAV
jgi:hypothetical protein